MRGALVVYLGLVLTLVAGLSLLRPLVRLGLDSRARSALALLLGLTIVVVGEFLPAKRLRITPPRTLLDRFAPEYQFNEFHSIRIAAPRDRVYLTMKSVTAEEITFFRTLTWLRRLGRPGAESILSPPPDIPIIDVATRTSFLLLAEEPGEEIVIGSLVIVPTGWRPADKLAPGDFEALVNANPPGFAAATMNFRIEEAGPAACTLTTETRVYATDASTRRRFARYWRVIYPGSALIRRMWLRAIARRTELGSETSVASVVR
jgi:hypothetical protein